MSIAPPPETASRFLAGRRLARPARADVASSASLPVRLLFAVFLVFDFPAFTIQFAVDGAGRWVGSPVLQLITLSSELFVFGLILASRDTRKLVVQCWPVWGSVAIAFISAAWSRNAGATIHTGNTYLTTALLGVVLVGALPQFQSIKFVIRLMVFGCLLSILWVILFPEAAIHQLTDPYQTVHAGLWRGVFSHKQGLGYFSGLTTGLLLFYRTSIFPLPIWAVSLACSVTCLIGTQSATGIVASVITPAFLSVSYFIAQLPVSLRKPMFVKFAIGLAAIGVGYKLGILNFVIGLLGKSTDLTGRADFWPFILQNFHNSGYDLFGGGFGAGIAADLSEWSVDNGYIDKYLEFGYVSTPIVFALYAAIVWGGIRLILTTPAELALTRIFPFSVFCVILILNITESNFMAKCLSTVITAMAAGLIFQARAGEQRRFTS